MKRLRLRTLTRALGMLAAFGLGSAAYADNHEEDVMLTDVWVFAAKSGMGSDLLDGFQAYFELRDAAGDSRDYEIYTPVISENMNRVMVRGCCFDWAGQDAYIKEREDVEGLDGKFAELVRPYVDHVHRYFERNDSEHSHVVDGKFDGPYYGETTWMIGEGFHPEAGEARRAVSKELLDGYASDENQWLWINRIGGKPALSLVNSFENFADMARPEQTAYDFMLEKHGAEKTASMFKDFTLGKTSSSYTVWKRQDKPSMDDES